MDDIYYEVRCLHCPAPVDWRGAVVIATGDYAEAVEYGRNHAIKSGHGCKMYAVDGPLIVRADADI